MNLKDECAGVKYINLAKYWGQWRLLLNTASQRSVNIFTDLLGIDRICHSSNCKELGIELKINLNITL
jgi:hypothetical protein